MHYHLHDNDGAEARRSGLPVKRIAGRQHRNWLIFGERNAAYDAFFDDELRCWESEGSLQRVDRIYSRDQAERRYVQHRLIECADELREWIAEGAYLYVCGSLAGMAPGVHAALIDVLGETVVESLTLAGRYRRDVY